MPCLVAIPLVPLACYFSHGQYLLVFSYGAVAPNGWVRQSLWFLGRLLPLGFLQLNDQESELRVSDILRDVRFRCRPPPHLSGLSLLGPSSPVWQGKFYFAAADDVGCFVGWMAVLRGFFPDLDRRLVNPHLVVIQQWLHLAGRLLWNDQDR